MIPEIVTNRFGLTTKKSFTAEDAEDAEEAKEAKWQK